MRFWSFVGIFFFLTLEDSEGATQASCATGEYGYSNDWVQQLNMKICNLIIDVVDDEDFTFSSAIDRLTKVFECNRKPRVKFLPTNVSRVFPDLISFRVEFCSVTTVSKNHFRNFFKLKYLILRYNQIEHVAGDSFVDLVNLEELDLSGNRIQLSVNTFSSLRSLNVLQLSYNKIQHLDLNIFKSLVAVEKIFLNGILIATLDDKIFESLANLKEIHLSVTKLKEIPENLFQNNLKLEMIRLEYNEIEFIDANMFDHLPNLKMVSFISNVCWNKKYIKEFGEFDRMRSDLKQNCSAA